MEDKIIIIKADKGLYKDGESIDVGGSIFYIIGFTKDNDIKVMPPEYYEGSSYQLEFLKKTVAEDEERYQKLCDENEELENNEGKYNNLIDKYSELQEKHIELMGKYTNLALTEPTERPNPLKEILKVINNHEGSKIILSSASHQPVDLSVFSGMKAVMSSIGYNGHATLLYKGADIQQVEIEDMFKLFEED